MEEICSHEKNKKIIDVYFLIYLFFKAQLNNMCQKLIISQIYVCVCVCVRARARAYVRECMYDKGKETERKREKVCVCMCKYITKFFVKNTFILS